MSVDMCKTIYAEDIEPGDQLDLSMDELCYSASAEAEYAEVERKTDWWNGESGEPWCTLYTSQGRFEVPADHRVKRKVQE